MNLLERLMHVAQLLVLQEKMLSLMLVPVPLIVAVYKFVKKNH